jgi:hypothetical protein
MRVSHAVSAVFDDPNLVSCSRYPGFDSPFDGAVVPATFVLLGSAIGSQAQPARIEVARLDTGALVVDDAITSSGEKPQPVDFSKSHGDGLIDLDAAAGFQDRASTSL